MYASMYEYVHVCAGALRSQDTLELELQVVTSCHVGAKKQTLILCKSSQCS